MLPCTSSDRHLIRNKKPSEQLYSPAAGVAVRFCGKMCLKPSELSPAVAKSVTFAVQHMVLLLCKARGGPAQSRADALSSQVLLHDLDLSRLLRWQPQCRSHCNDPDAAPPPQWNSSRPYVYLRTLAVESHALVALLHANARVHVPHYADDQLFLL